MDIAVTAGVITGDPGSSVQTLDVSGHTIVPGFIDLQINGGLGIDFTTDPAGIWTVASVLPRHGVTAFVPTLVSPTRAMVETALEVLAAGPPDDWRGATPLGLHCEGPMIAPSRRGAHPQDRLCAADLVMIEGWSRQSGVMMATVAPELDGAIEVIRELARRGVVVAVGHTDADFETVVRAVTAGASHGTHLFNAMTGLDHRHPGAAAALLDQPNVTVGLVPDGVHVHPAMMRSAWRLRQGEVAIVTDATAAMGMGDCTTTLAGRPITVRDGVARTADGVLAGSVLTMDEAVRRFVEHTGCEPSAATSAASTTPARILSDPIRGTLRPGARGDLVVLDDCLTVQTTIIAGVVV